MSTPPQTVLDVFPAPDPGKQLVDPTVFYQMLQLTLGYQALPMTSTVGSGAPITQAVTLFTGANAGGGNNWQAQLPVGLGGLRLTLINLATSPVNINPSYNPAVGRPDSIVGVLPIPQGNVYTAICYQPGYWFVAVTAAGPVLDEPPSEC